MKTETLTISPARGVTSAHVALPDEEASSGIILIHEWWGINDHIRDLASRYAAEGFICVAPDLFRGTVAKNTKEASALMNGLPIADGIETIRAALAETKTKYNVEQLGINGYCMGGTFALRAACEIPEFAAAAPFYGDIPEEGVLRELRVPTLFIAGKLDSWINPEKVSGLEAAARKFGLPVEVVSYDADHAFFNDTRPEVYDSAAASDAWRRVLGHFRRHFDKAASA
jgi:carboxymethylenebutenolidase